MIDKSTDLLKWCPFCGGPPEYASFEIDPWGKETIHYVRCFECEATPGGKNKTREEAARLWNTRTTSLKP